MYLSRPGPRATGQGGQVGPPHVVRACRRTFAGPAEFLLDPHHRADIGTYLSDMLRPYGLALIGGLVDAPSGDIGHSYGEMAEALIATIVSAVEPVDLLILAFAIHDVRPGRATATYLSHVCPGNPMAFAVCDQGTAAAFTGLRLAGEYLGTDGLRRALLLIVEQATLPYHPPADGLAAPAAIPAQHSGVALLCASGGEGEPGPARPNRVLGVRQHTGVAAETAPDLAMSEVADLAAGEAGVTVVLGGALAAVWPGRDGDDNRPVPAGRPYTGVWWELAGILAEPGSSRRLLLADYDPQLRYLCLCAVDRG